MSHPTTLTPKVEHEFAALVSTGTTFRRAALLLGIPPTTARHWLHYGQRPDAAPHWRQFAQAIDDARTEQQQTAMLRLAALRGRLD